MNLMQLSNGRGCRRQRSAFTLVELLVAIAIFSSAVTIVYSTLYTGLKSYHRTQQQLEFSRDLDQVIEKLAAELRNSVSPYAVAFAPGGRSQLGSDNSLSFFTIHDAYTQQGMKKVLARMSYVFHDKTLFKKQQLDKDALLDENGFEEEALLTDIESFHFSYLHAEPKETSMAVSWQPDWLAKDQMPYGVAVELTWHDPETDMSLTIDRTVVIAQGALNDVEGE